MRNSYSLPSKSKSEHLVEPFVTLQSRSRGSQFCKLNFGDRQEVDVVRSVGEPQGPSGGPEAGQWEIVGHAAAPVDLDGLVDDLQDSSGGYNLGYSNLLPSLHPKGESEFASVASPM